MRGSFPSDKHLSPPTASRKLSKFSQELGVCSVNVFITSNILYVNSLINMHLHTCTYPYTHLRYCLRCSMKKGNQSPGGLHFFSYSQNTESTLRGSSAFLPTLPVSCLIDLALLVRISLQSFPKSVGYFVDCFPN